MASGSFKTGWGQYDKDYELIVEWSSTANVASNTSTVRAVIKFYCPYACDMGKRYNNKVVINGVSYDYTSPAVKTSGNETFTLATIDSGAIAHNADGSKSIAISATFRFNASLSGVQYGEQTASKTVALDNIPRKATVTAAPNFNDEANPTISYTNSAGNAVTSLKACISLDGSADDVAYRDISKTGSSYTFNLTAAERKILRAACKDANSRTVRFYVQTVIGGVTHLHYLSKTLSIINAAPVLNPTAADVDSEILAITGDSSKLVKYYSNPQFAINATAQKEATIKSYLVTCGSQTRTEATGTFYNVESGSIVFKATDSRGNTTTKTVSLTLIPYVQLTCNLSAKAPTTAGDMDFTISGNYYNASIGATANSLIVQYRYKINSGQYGEWIAAAATKSGNTYKAAVALSGLNYLNTYTFQARAWDVVQLVESAEKKVKTTPVFDWSENDFNLNVPLHIKNNAVLRVNGENNNTVLSANNSTDGIFLRPNGTGSADGQAYLTPEGAFNMSALKVGGRAYGANKVLWSGSWYMTAGQTAELDEAISSQPNGVVLIFSRYSNGAAENANFNCFFVPKQLVSAHGGAGSCFQMATVNFSVCAAKYLYISDAKITGNDLNSAAGTGTSGIKYENNAYVLRYVIGV